MAVDKEEEKLETNYVISVKKKNIPNTV